MWRILVCMLAVACLGLFNAKSYAVPKVKPIACADGNCQTASGCAECDLLKKQQQMAAQAETTEVASFGFGRPANLVRMNDGTVRAQFVAQSQAVTRPAVAVQSASRYQGGCSSGGCGKGGRRGGRR